MKELNRIYNEDCLKGLKDVETGSVDMILTDLPYGVTACKWDSIIPLEEMWAEFTRVTKENAAIVLTACQPFTTKLIASNPKMFKYNWIWVKPQGVDPRMAKKRPMNNYEDVCVFYKKQPIYNPQFEKGKPYMSKTKARFNKITGSMDKARTTVNTGFRYPKRTLDFNRETGLHPTQKPVKLFRYFIRTYTNPGATVLDACSGSGTTAVACIHEERDFLCFEMDREIFEGSLKRLEFYLE